MHFRIRGLPAEQFAPLFSLSDEELAATGAVRRIADDRNPGYPCRVSLTDSNPGDELILVNYEHHAVDSPYRMRFAIYVRPGDKTFDAFDTVPDQLRARMLAVRAFDTGAMMIRPRLGRWQGTRTRNRAVVRRRASGLSAHSLCLAGLLRRARRSRVTALQAARQRISRSAPATIRVRPATTAAIFSSVRSRNAAPNAHSDCGS
jgi:hypothetical protein